MVPKCDPKGHIFTNKGITFIHRIQIIILFSRNVHVFRSMNQVSQLLSCLNSTFKFCIPPLLKGKSILGIKLRTNCFRIAYTFLQFLSVHVQIGTQKVCICQICHRKRWTRDKGNAKANGDKPISELHASFQLERTVHTATQKPKSLLVFLLEGVILRKVDLM